MINTTALQDSNVHSLAWARINTEEQKNINKTFAGSSWDLLKVLFVCFFPIRNDPNKHKNKCLPPTQSQDSSPKFVCVFSFPDQSVEYTLKYHGDRFDLRTPNLLLEGLALPEHSRDTFWTLQSLAPKDTLPDTPVDTTIFGDTLRDTARHTPGTLQARRGRDTPVAGREVPKFECTAPSQRSFSVKRFVNKRELFTSFSPTILL